MYQALYRKWRPRVFDDVVGQEAVTRTLKRQVAADRLSHAYLFTGTRGTGKTTCAKILARAVNCEHPVDGNPCNECAACRGIDSGALLDVLELDAASNNGVDQIRALRDEAAYTPAHVRRRVYIVDEVHMLSTSAFNALLKILEEPPEHLMFILATTELHKVPATILSRCQRFAFRRIVPEDIAQRLRHVADCEAIDLTEDGARLLSRMADGALRDALSLLDQCAASGERVDSASVLQTLGLAGNRRTAQLMDLILEEKTEEALSLLNELYAGGKDMSAVLHDLSALGRDLLIMKTAPRGGAALLCGGYDTPVLSALGEKCTAARLIAVLSVLQDAAASLLHSTNVRIDAELCILKLCDTTLAGDLTPIAARLERVEEHLRRMEEPGAVRPSIPPQSAPQSDVPPPSDADAPPDWDTPPWDDDTPPPAPQRAAPPVRKAAEEKVRAVPRDNTPPQAMQGDADGDWKRLAEAFKARLPMTKRAYFNMAVGRVTGDKLIIACQNDFVKNMLTMGDTPDEMRTVASDVLGREVALEFTVQSAAARSEPKEQSGAEERESAAPPAPVPAAEGSPLDALMEKMQELEHFTID